MPVHITIAIDGYAGCGKSSTARQVARKLNYLFIDSGAMYRSVTLYALRHNLPYDQDNDQIRAALADIHLTFDYSEGQFLPGISMNGEPVEKAIRTPEVSGAVSQVATLASVREAMVDQQRRIAAESGVVMDGRDIGTVVFPHAALKIFMQADLDVRARRRLTELDQQGINTSLEAVIENLKARDKTDTTRAISPLRKAEDAIVIDTTHLAIEDQVNKVCDLAWERMGQSSPS
jgi:cytidylate kinase